MPYATKSDNLCIVDGKVYISDYQRPSILEYNPDTDTWMTLSTPTIRHGMVSHNGKLTLVGGLTNESTSHNPLATSKIRVWDSNSKQWTEPYPPMTIERAEVECASCLHYLIIASVKEVGITASWNHCWWLEDKAMVTVCYQRSIQQQLLDHTLSQFTFNLHNNIIIEFLSLERYNSVYPTALYKHSTPVFVNYKIYNIILAIMS